MDISFTRVDDPAAHPDELVEFLTGHEWPYHVTRRVDHADVAAWIADSRLSDIDHASYWIDVDDRRVGLATLQDLGDDAPLFDLRLATGHRGRGLGAEILKTLATFVFTTMPAVHRFEGQTRDDNIAMRKTFLRAGFVKEAHYRDGWPVENEPPRASVAYSILRRDWQTGQTSPVDWNDLPP